MGPAVSSTSGVPTLYTSPDVAKRRQVPSDAARQLQSEGRAHAFLTSDGGHRLIERTRRQLAISHDAAYIAVYNYLIFLLLKEEAEDWNADKLSPTGAIDEIWHMHILDTAHYGDDVRELCPSLVEKDKMFHYNPDRMLDESESRKRTAEMMENRMKRGKMYWSFDGGGGGGGGGGERGEGGGQGGSTNSTTGNTPEEADGKMLLFAKTLTGRTYSMRVSPFATVLEVKEMIKKQDGLCVKAQRLIFAGKQLEDNRTLQDYNIQKECTLHLIMRLLGC